MTQTAIRTTNLACSFGSVRAVDGISLEVPRGTVFGFLGPNGAGKTTTIRLLLGLLEPTSGEAEVLGFNTHTHGDQVRERCGALLEHNGLYERLSAYDNLDFYGRIWHIPAGKRQARLKELLSNLDLWERRDETTGSWSRGMKQKLAVARVLLHHPELVFLDEPTAGLDPIASAALREDLANLAKSEGVTIFLTTHNLAEAEKLCQQVAVIRQGKLVATGSPDELRRTSGKPRLEISGSGFSEQALDALKIHPQVAAVSAEMNRLVIDFKQPCSSAPFISLLVNAGAQIEEVLKGKIDLEDAFLSLLEKEQAE
jgi:ABC-2 type transport system ATP-binding protein